MKHAVGVIVSIIFTSFQSSCETLKFNRNNGGGVNCGTLRPISLSHILHSVSLVYAIIHMSRACVVSCDVTPSVTLANHNVRVCFESVTYAWVSIWLLISTCFTYRPALAVHYTYSYTNHVLHRTNGVFMLHNCRQFTCIISSNSVDIIPFVARVSTRQCCHSVGRSHFALAWPLTCRTLTCDLFA